jgi:hypothetical protein
MSAQRATRTAGSDRQEQPFWQRYFAALAALAPLALALLLPACTQAPLSRSLAPDPADPRAAAAPVTYRSTTAGYSSRRPVEPRPWGEQNQRVAPADKP